MSVSRQMQQQETMSKFISTVRHDKRTTFMDPKEELYFLHFLQNDPIVGDFIRSQMAKNPTFRREILKQPVCPKCEKFCFFDKNGTAMCPKHGRVPMENTHSLKSHIRDGYYR